MSRSEKFWDRTAQTYGTEVNDPTQVSTVEQTRKYLNPDDVVLDFACGTGLFSFALADQVKSIQAIDLSSSMIAIAKQQAHERGIDNIDFAQATLFDVDYPDESYDVVLALNILHLLEDGPRAVQRINTLLKPSGLFISATACMGDRAVVLGLFLSALSKLRLVPYLKRYKSTEVEALIAAAGFQIIETNPLPGEHPTHFIATRKV